MEWLAILMFVVVCAVLMLGYPVAFSLAGTALLFSIFGIFTGTFDQSLLNAFTEQVIWHYYKSNPIGCPFVRVYGRYARKVESSRRAT